MERYNPDRSHEIASHPEASAVSAAENVRPPFPHTDDSVRPGYRPIDANEDAASAQQFPPETTEPPPPEANPVLTVRRAFDRHLRRLQRLQAGLKQVPAEGETPETAQHDTRKLLPQRPRLSHQQPTLLHETLIYLDQVEHPPLLPAPRIVSFEDGFRRHEAMFHTVFYRKYPPWVLDDAKQEGLLALFRRWLKDKSVLEQSSSYVVQAAIYGVSNWRKKAMKIRGREGALVVDGHGKVMGEPSRSLHERWTDHLDLRLDVARAANIVLDQYEEHPEYREIYRALEDIRQDIPFRTGSTSVRSTVSRLQEPSRAGESGTANTTARVCSSHETGGATMTIEAQ